MELQILAMQEASDREADAAGYSSNRSGNCATGVATGSHASPVRQAQRENTSIVSPMSPEEEKDHLDRALTASLSADASHAPENLEVLHSTMRASLLEMEMLHRQEEMENAELMKAVALSLALEEERISALNAESKQTNINAAEAGSGRDGSKFPRTAEAKHSEKVDVDSDAGEEDDENEDEYGDTLQDPYFEHNDSDVKNAERSRGQQSSPTLSQTLADAKRGSSESRASSSSKTACGTSTAESAEFDAGGVARVPKKTKKPKKKLISEDKNGGSDFALLKPLTMKPLGGLTALPAIRSEPVPTREEMDKMNEELAKKKREVELVIRQNQQQLAEKRAAEDDLKSKLQQMDPNEAERRAVHMREQRDRLLAKKKAEREAKVRAEEERFRNEQDERIDNRPVDFLKQQAKLGSDDSEEKTDPSGFTKEEVEESRRGAMRNALARRMKLGLVESEESRISNMQKAQFSELENKLKQVEQLRSDSRLRDQAIHDRIHAHSLIKKAQDVGMEDI